MPAPIASTQRSQALVLLKRRGMVRLAEFGEAGITATTVSRMERAGEVVRLARGLYQLADADLDPQQSLAEAARLVPKGVICLASALALHGLTDQMPPKVWIAIGRKDWRPRVSYPPMRVARFSDDLLQRSVEHKKIAGTPDDCIAAVERLDEVSGGFGALLVQVIDWAPREKMLRSFELLARYVRPRFQGSLIGIEGSSRLAMAHRKELDTARATAVEAAFQEHEHQAARAGGD